MSALPLPRRIRFPPMPPPPTPLERLTNTTSHAFPAIAVARARTTERLIECRALLDGVAISPNATVALMGSWGRQELTGGSDDDCVVLVRGLSSGGGWGSTNDTPRPSPSERLVVRQVLRGIGGRRLERL